MLWRQAATSDPAMPWEQAPPRPPAALISPTSHHIVHGPASCLWTPPGPSEARRAGSTPWGKPLQWAGSQQVAWPCTIIPSDCPPPACVSPWHQASQPQTYSSSSSLFKSLPPPRHPAPRDQLSANLMAPESSSWSHKPRTQTRHCPSPHSQAPLGTT